MSALKVAFKLFLIFVFSILALFSMLIAYTSYEKVDDLKTWQPLSATVTSSSIEEEHRSKGKTYCPVVNVRYVFQDREQTSRLDIEDGSCSPIQSSVEKTIKNYQHGTLVNAFVNPEKASEIRIANYTLGTIFYLMSFLSVLLWGGVIYTWRTPANKLVNSDA